jgi:hypothetical protein
MFLDSNVLWVRILGTIFASPWAVGKALPSIRELHDGTTSPDFNERFPQ